MRLVHCAFLFLCAALTAVPSSAYAHQYKIDGSIGVVLHTDPDDDPIVMEPARLYFYVKDENGSFAAADCDCHVRITYRDRTLKDEKLRILSDKKYGSNVFNTDIIFPERAIYAILITGRSLTKSFRDFAISYDLRVDRTSSPPPQKPVQSSVSFIPMVSTGIGVIILGIVGFLKKSEEK